LVYDSTNYQVLYNSSKSFIIDHPTKPDSYLVHACLEGPEAGVYYRGKSTITNNEFVKIELPDYVDKLAKNFTVQITSIYDEEIKKIIVFSATEVKNNSFKVFGENGSFCWLVCGERLSVLTEPHKEDIEVSGDGPYKYISKINNFNASV